jgi:hypothetical protein
MAKLSTRRFIPTAEEANNGVLPLSKEEIVASLEVYKKQNPAKYEAKKEALFKRYGLAPEAVKDPVPDAGDIELAAIKKSVKKSK